jgi:hypothetical protein
VTFEATWFTQLLRPARLLAPLYGSEPTFQPAHGGFYFQAFNRSVSLPAARYNYNSVWTPLLAGLSPARTAASFAAPTQVTYGLCEIALLAAGNHRFGGFQQVTRSSGHGSAYRKSRAFTRISSI